jgi:hypothetical protein
MSDRPKTAPQVKWYQNRERAIEALKQRGKKADAKSVATLARLRREGKPNEMFFKEEEEAGNLLDDVVAPSPQTIPAQPAPARVQEPVPITENSSSGPKKPSVYALAGKKAVTSKKGAKWLANIASAKNTLDKAFRRAKLTRKSGRIEAIRLAKLRRNDPSGEPQFISNAIQSAQNSAPKPRKTRKNTSKNIPEEETFEVIEE